MTDALNPKEMSVILVVCTPSQLALTSDPACETAPTTSLPIVTPSGTPSSPAQRQEPVALSPHQALDHTIRDILARGDYGEVETCYCRNGYPSVEEAIEQAITRGARRIVIVPTAMSLLQIPPCECLAEDSPTSLRRRVAETQAQHPGTNIVYAGPPFDHERLADLILGKIREYEPPTFKAGVTQLNELQAGETGVVRELDGGTHFRSRMASLGFTPGALVKMLQNYRHGAVIVSLRGTRVALGRGEARKVGVSRGNEHR
jgi:ferrous iron transport protein A